MSIEWQPYTPDPSMPDDTYKYCDDGPFSHVWEFEFSPDGASLSTSDCEQCNSVVQGPWCDFFEYLGGVFKVRLVTRVERSGPFNEEHDFFIDMMPPETL